MEVTGKAAIVTGAASGIGRALAVRLATEGARSLVLADLDLPGLLRAAAEIGPRAVVWQGDVAAGAGVADLIATATEKAGAVDLFCANAGVAVGGAVETPDEGWERILNVNLMAHVRAARLLVPGWLERGEGTFLVTASAAGLLTQLGSATYSTTKHAAVAFAEWLSITYGDRGIQVGCLCPMMVRTPMFEAAFGGPGGIDDERGEAAARALSDVIAPAAVADAAIAGLRDGRFLILPHADVEKHFRHRGDDHERWLAGMRRLQAGLLAMTVTDAGTQKEAPR